MAAFSLSHKAKADLKSILSYTQKKWGREQRLIYAKQFDLSFHRLAETPEAGHNCDHIKTGYRKFPCASHIIFYRYIPQAGIQIVRVLHKRMDVHLQLDA
ncbi:type II toxin-antitoxin system RelE/ParE family toxin [uncultured Pseudoteredinibacter sp.]|uniref:type II toxin-antitoxin system RelE/ParE family toxin n=1 Tax=uncultured Pseudoteredinibacter sp. TaxID=1641701 RepID=UPI002630DF29|nr:type II toxin-antitoxin system RelE/ParE family toxin [uncultured Pseudoteredinibacter sp.]